MAFHQGSRQTIYGHGTFNLSFADNHSDVAIGTIRQLVEIRLRRATGIMWKTSAADNAIHPCGRTDKLTARPLLRTAS